MNLRLLCKQLLLLLGPLQHDHLLLPAAKSTECCARNERIERRPRGAPKAHASTAAWVGWDGIVEKGGTVAAQLARPGPGPAAAYSKEP